MQCNESQRNPYTDCNARNACLKGQLAASERFVRYILIKQKRKKMPLVWYDTIFHQHFYCSDSKQRSMKCKVVFHITQKFHVSIRSTKILLPCLSVVRGLTAIPFHYGMYEGLSLDKAVKTNNCMFSDKALQYIHRIFSY